MKHRIFAVAATAIFVAGVIVGIAVGPAEQVLNSIKQKMVSAHKTPL